MAQTALQRLKEKFSSIGLGKSTTDDQNHRFFSASELACLKSQVQTANRLAREEVRRNNVGLHPRIAALKARSLETVN